jgi:hypothetical protein
MRRSNFALRLQPPPRKVAEMEGVALNQFINVAVTEKLSALRTESYFEKRAVRGDIRVGSLFSSVPASASPQ